MELFTISSSYLTTFATVAVAISLGVVGFLININQHKSEFTLKLVIELFNDPRYANISKIIEDHFLTGKTIEPDELPPESLSEYSALMSILEYISFAYRQNKVNRKTIERMAIHRIHKAFWTGQRFIIQKRKSDKAYFCELEHVATHSHQSTKFSKLFSKNSMKTK